MKKIETNLKDCYILEPNRFGDDRGYFSPFFIAEDLKKEGIKFGEVVQCNRSLSGKGIVRGLHFQKDYPQGKLVRVLVGSVFDVAVDMRPGSKTYGKWYGRQ